MNQSVRWMFGHTQPWSVTYGMKKRVTDSVRAFFVLAVCLSILDLLQCSPTCIKFRAERQDTITARRGFLVELVFYISSHCYPQGAVPTTVIVSNTTTRPPPVLCQIIVQNGNCNHVHRRDCFCLPGTEVFKALLALKEAGPLSEEWTVTAHFDSPPMDLKTTLNIQIQEISLSVYNTTQGYIFVDDNATQDYNISVDYNTTQDYNISVDYNTTQDYNISVDYNTTQDYSISVDYNTTEDYNISSDYSTAQNHLRSTRATTVPAENGDNGQTGSTDSDNSGTVLLALTGCIGLLAIALIGSLYLLKKRGGVRIYYNHPGPQRYPDELAMSAVSLPHAAQLVHSENTEDWSSMDRDESIYTYIHDSELGTTASSSASLVPDSERHQHLLLTISSDPSSDAIVVGESSISVKVTPEISSASARDALSDVFSDAHSEKPGGNSDGVDPSSVSCAESNAVSQASNWSCSGVTQAVSSTERRPSSNSCAHSSADSTGSRATIARLFSTNSDASNACYIHPIASDSESCDDASAD